MVLPNAENGEYCNGGRVPFGYRVRSSCRFRFGDGLLTYSSRVSRGSRPVPGWLAGLMAGLMLVSTVYAPTSVLAARLASPLSSVPTQTEEDSSASGPVSLLEASMSAPSARRTASRSLPPNPSPDSRSGSAIRLSGRTRDAGARLGARRTFADQIVYHHWVRSQTW